MRFQDALLPGHYFQGSSFDFVRRQVTFSRRRDHERQIPRRFCKEAILKPDQCNLFCLRKSFTGLFEGSCELHSVDNFSHRNSWGFLQKSLHLILSDAHGQRFRQSHHAPGLHSLLLIPLLEKRLLEQLMDKTILNEILVENLLDARSFNSFCEPFLHFVDKRFYRKLALSSFCHNHEKANQVLRLQVIADPSDQNPTDGLFRDSSHFGCLNGSLEVLFTSGITGRQAQSHKQNAENCQV